MGVTVVHAVAVLLLVPWRWASAASASRCSYLSHTFVQANMPNEFKIMQSQTAMKGAGGAEPNDGQVLLWDMSLRRVVCVNVNSILI